MQKSTKTALIIVLSVVGALVLLSLVCVIGGVIWFKENAEEIERDARRSTDEAAEFSSTHHQNDCVTESLRRAGQCGGGLAIMCETNTRLFLGACLEGAAPVDGFCDGVPRPSSIVDGARWAQRECANVGRPSDQRCGRLLSEIPSFCGRR